MSGSDIDSSIESMDDMHDVNEDGARDLLGDGGIMKTIINAGEGFEKPAKGTEVSVHYTGTLTDGTKFDSSVDRGQYFKFVLGQGNVIKGWDETVATMKRGEKCKVVLKPEYAYGAQGSLPTIPPDATLIFEIELFEFSNTKDISKAGDGSIMKKGLTPSPQKFGDAVAYDSECNLLVTVKHGDDILVQDIEQTVTIGQGQLPKGIEIAIKSLLEGEMAEFQIQPQLAFGSQGSEKFHIPSNVTTTWIIKLVTHKKPTPHWKLEKADQIEVATKGKVIGNELFSSGQYQLAVKRYKNASSYVASGPANDRTMEVKTLNIAIDLNLAQCYLNLKKISKAITHIKKVLAIEPDNLKGLYRHGLAMMANQEWDLAKSDFERILALDSNNGTAKSQLAASNKMIHLQNQKDRAVYAKMFA